MIKPIALTCGEPSSIAPEITVKAWKALKNEVNFVLFTSFEYMKKRFPETPMKKVINCTEAINVMANAIPIIDVPFSEEPKVGKVNDKLAIDIIRSIEMATERCMTGEAAALCTNPINKFALSSGANFKHTGHTDFLKFLTNSKQAVMMIASDRLRVTPITIHVSLKEAITTLTDSLIKDTIVLSHQALIELFDIKKPRIFVSGLNPHAGENGLFGDEESNLILPAINLLRKSGLDINGPFSADTMFHDKIRKNYDLAVCMYHDQALIPIKTISFDEAVNITLGLPIVRTSPDHGTANEIAGKNKASPISLINAIRMAKKLSENNNLYANR